MKIQFDFKERIDKYGLILTSLFIKNKQVIMFIDTGSTGNIIDISLVKELKIDIPNLKTVKLSGFNFDGYFECANTIIKDISVENIFNTDIKFTVIDIGSTIKTFSDSYGITIYGILGNNFLLENNVTIDFKNKKITYESND